MFDKSTKSRSSNEIFGKTNRIVDSTIIKGDITSQDDFRLDGELIGNFRSGGKLVIGPTGKIKGEIICKNLDIEGFFEGKIQIEETLCLKSTAVIIGDVICDKLTVEPGAEFNGTCSMKQTVKNLTQDTENKNDEKDRKKVD